MISALVVSDYEGFLKMMKRRVEGILKGLARVDMCFLSDLDNCNAELLVTAKYGKSFSYLKERNAGIKSISLEFTPIAVGLKKLAVLPVNLRLGVVAFHQGCANYFLSELIQSIPIENKCYPGTFAEMQQMPVDKFLVPEEMQGFIKKPVRQEIIPIPRTISPSSTAELIDVVLDISNK